MAARAPRHRDDKITVVLRALEERSDGHDQFCNQVERNRKAYHAVVERNSDTDRKRNNWRSTLTPHHIEPVVDTLMANLIDDRVRFKVQPRPHVGASEAEVQLAIEGAKAHELLLSYQMDMDRFVEKQTAFVMQSLIAGLTCAKVHWLAKPAVRRSLATRKVPVIDAETEEQIGWDVEDVDLEEEFLLRDDPTFEVVRIEDFLWAEGSQDVQSAPWVIHRTYQTLEELRGLEKLGVYQNVEQLTDDAISEGYRDQFWNLDKALLKDDRTKGRVEVLEMYRKDRGVIECITVGDRKVRLKHARDQYDHGEYPFVTCSPRPEPFTLPGRSVVAAIAPLQEALWSIGNQRLDNLELVNNQIFVFQDDLIDRDMLQFFPGAMWAVPGDVDKGIKAFAPDIQAATVSLAAEALLKGELQNSTNNMPFASGANSGTIDQETATGVSIVTSLAQKSMSFQKQILYWAYERVGHQFLGLNQQFIQEDRLVAMIGQDGAQAFYQIAADALPGTYHVSLTPTTESLMRQERRAESQSLFQVAVSAAGHFAAMRQSDPNTPLLNLKAFMDNVLEQYDITDKERFYTVAPPPPQMMPGAPGQGQPQMNGGAPMGTTSPQAYDQTSPSNANSMSGEAAMQRALAMQGGVSNA